MKQLVLLGGGHAHVEVLRQFAEQPAEGVQLTLVSPHPWLTYSGMVPGHVAGHYELDDCRVDLARLAERAKAALVLTAAAGVRPNSREVDCADGRIVRYDLLSIDVGSHAALGAARGVEAHAVPLRPLERALKAWNDVLVRARDGRMAAVTIVGGGAAGVELAMAMDHRFRRELFEVATHVRVISAAPRLVPDLAPGAARQLHARMRRFGVEAHVGSEVAEVGDGYVRLKSGIEFATDAVFWAAGAAAPPWLRTSGFACDERGFILTNDFLQSPSHPQVFAAGDCSNELGHPLPKAGVFAVRAGPALAHNLRAALEERALAPHLPKPKYLALVSAGRRDAVMAWNGFAAGGWWAWRWKDRIDRAWIARYREGLPPR